MGVVGLACGVGSLLAAALRCGLKTQCDVQTVVELFLLRTVTVLLPALALAQPVLRLLVYAVANGMLATLFNHLERQAAARAGHFEQGFFFLIFVFKSIFQHQF